MKKILIAVALMFVISIFADTEGEKKYDGINWLTNLEEAQEIAAEKDLPIFVDFTGSDWCGWCKKLENEVFSKSDFIEYANENLVMLKIDFPKYKQQSTEIKTYNQALLQKYDIQGFPTILLLNAEGEVLGRTGYQYGGSDKYIEHIKGILGQE